MEQEGGQYGAPPAKKNRDKKHAYDEATMIDRRWIK